jgi:glycosidase
MKFWITEADIDGFRCDVAMEVPTPFWNRARKELDAVKPVFMLAEAESPEHHDYAFDMSYAWELHHIMNSIARGEKNANDLASYFSKRDTTFAKDAYRMAFITNHDENSWNGTEYERMGDAVSTFAMLTYTLPGMPMIYSGQEAAFNERLEFFEKDTIDWGGYPQTGFYKQLAKLRKDNPALWSGKSGACLERLTTSQDTLVFAFKRIKDENAVFVMANLSNQPVTFSISLNEQNLELVQWPSNQPFEYSKKKKINLDAWQYKVLVGRVLD